MRSDDPTAYVPLSVRNGGRRETFDWWLKGRREAIALKLAPWFTGAVVSAVPLDDPCESLDSLDLPGEDGLRDRERALLRRARAASSGTLLLGPHGIDALVEAIETTGRLRVGQLEQLLSDLEDFGTA